VATVFKDPIGWAAIAVQTKTRFRLTVILAVIMHAVVLLQVSMGGVFSALVGVTLLAWFHFLVLYALRRLYQELLNRHSARAA
jgi:hypothetical protein